MKFLLLFIIYSFCSFAELIELDWNKSIWIKKQKQNPLSSISICKKFFKTEKVVNDYGNCAPAHEFVLFKDKGSKKIIAFHSSTLGCIEEYSYRFNNKNVGRDKFCEKIIKYNLNCKGCLN